MNPHTSEILALLGAGMLLGAFTASLVFRIAWPYIVAAIRRDEFRDLYRRYRARVESTPAAHRHQPQPFAEL